MNKCVDSFTMYSNILKKKYVAEKRLTEYVSLYIGGCFLLTAP